MSLCPASTSRLTFERAGLPGLDQFLVWKIALIAD
jgi:hypothetical protein